tara:strand:+ start:39 stop:755 length:717 start_codon:yes stop_codon:yes gene_type:complete
MSLRYSNTPQPKATTGKSMRKFQPAQVDWDEIRLRVQEGEGFSSVAKDYEVSRQAIQKRCKKEEWVSDKPLTLAVKKALRKRNQVSQPDATVQPAQPVAVVQPQPRRDHSDLAAAKSSSSVLVRDDKKDAVLALLKDGVPKIHAAQAVGVHENTLARWLQEDSEFGVEVRSAESEAVALRVQRIGKAGEKDWRADSWYLERTQKATFGAEAGKGSGVAVQINIMRGDDAEVIDVTPAG